MLIPGNTVPELEVSMLGADSWRLANSAAEHFTMLVFYRGVHCPICKGQLELLNERIDDFAAMGVNIFALSMDSEDRARRAFEEWEIRRVPLGYDLTLEQARDWGLYISEGFQDSEPQFFSEPATFLVRPDNELYAAYVQSVPFGRPDLDSLKSGIEFVLQKDYPTRGTATDKELEDR